MSNKVEYISVIIPTYQPTTYGHDRLRGSLMGYSNQSINKDQFEIILIDDGSNTNVEMLIAKWNLTTNIKYMRQKHTGMCSAIQFGIKEASHEYILLSIDDNIPHPKLLEAHLASLSSYPASLIVGREYHIRKYKDKAHPINFYDNKKEHTNGIPINYITKTYEMLIKEGLVIDKYVDIENILSNQHHLAGINNLWMTMRIGNHSLSKRILEDIGGIDTNFDPSGWYMDLELGYRLTQNKVNIVFNADAIMVHISHNHPKQTTLDEINKHKYFFEKHKDLNIALLPLFFASKLSISEYSDLVNRINHMIG